MSPNVGLSATATFKHRSLNWYNLTLKSTASESSLSQRTKRSSIKQPKARTSICSKRRFSVAVKEVLNEAAPKSVSSGCSVSLCTRMLWAYRSPWTMPLPREPGECRWQPAAAMPCSTLSMNGVVKAVPSGNVSRVMVSNDGGLPRIW